MQEGANSCVPHTVPWDSRSLAVATRGADPGSGQRGGILGQVQQQRASSSLAVCLCLEIKALLDTEGISTALLCHLCITAIASQTEAPRAQETTSVLLQEGKC